MIDIKNKKCLGLNCKKYPSYGLETDSKPTFCGTHKTPDMINIRDKRC
jgi:hypothetical protein